VGTWRRINNEANIMKILEKRKKTTKTKKKKLKTKFGV